MDINSREALNIDLAFIRAKMKMTKEGFLNVETNSLYGKTNKDRIVRYDRTLDQYNVLSDNRRVFTPVLSLRQGERLLADGAFRREDLLPDKTFWETTKETILPRLGQAGIGVIVGFCLHGIWHQVPAMFGYLRDCLKGDNKALHEPLMALAKAHKQANNQSFAVTDLSAAQSGDLIYGYDDIWAQQHGISIADAANKDKVL